MRKCPFCAEEIQEEAVKCRYCGEFLIKKQKTSWYFQTQWIILIFLCAGPLMLPLIWFHPRYSKTKKVSITLILLIVTFGLGILVKTAFKSISEYYGLIFEYM